MTFIKLTNDYGLMIAVNMDRVESMSDDGDGHTRLVFQGDGQSGRVRESVDEILACIPEAK